MNNKLFTPGIMISQVCPESQETLMRTYEVIKLATGDGFFNAVQIVDVPYVNERLKIRQFVQENEISLTYCITRILNRERLNLSSLDESLRARSSKRAIEALEEAYQCGAESIALISGHKPYNESDRQIALRKLSVSLKEICTSAKQFGINVIIEPLDYYAHKKNTLGATEEAVAIARKLSSKNVDLGICLDTAHVLLNGEDVLIAADICKEYARELHFCNYVTDKNNPLYGDSHLLFGPPGMLNEESIISIGLSLFNSGFIKPEMKVFNEIKKTQEYSIVDLIKYSKRILKKLNDICLCS